MSGSDGVVYVVDDDVSVRRGLERLLRSAGYRVVTFASAREFHDRRESVRPSCLVLDIRMPGQNGLDLHDALAASGYDVPVVFITGHGDIPMAVRAMKAGAIDFLAKPFDDKELLDALAASGYDVPVVFITGHGDIPMAVRAMKAGAIDFLAKPFDDKELLDAVQAAIVRGSRVSRSAPARGEV